nr:serine hydrolase domain-containing protein [uncultured Undibacterium sp.]
MFGETQLPHLQIRFNLKLSTFIRLESFLEPNDKETGSFLSSLSLLTHQEIISKYRFKSKENMMLRSTLLKLTIALLLAPSFSSAQAPSSTQKPEVLPKSEPQTNLVASDATSEPIAAMIDAYNSGDAAKIKQFIEKYTSIDYQKESTMAERITSWKTVNHQFGQLQFVSVQTLPSKDGELSKKVTLKDNAYGLTHERIMVFNSDAQPRLIKLSGGLGRLVQAKNETALTEEAMLARVEKTLFNVCSKNLFSGSFLIAKDNKILFQKACGEASKRYHAANNMETKFNLGSVPKMFTSVAIAQLVEQGKLSFDDKIDKWVDESWLPKEMTSQISLHHLLTHTSGLGSYFNKTFFDTPRNSYNEINDFKPLMKGEKLAFTPGSGWNYSNIGMLLVGVILEKVTGENYFDYIQKNIYAKSGMLNSDSYPSDASVENLAIGYTKSFNGKYQWQENTFALPGRGGPAGGGYSTAPDLLKFADALKNGKLVKPDTLSTMWTDHSKARYGYGFGIRNSPSGLTIGHNGGFPGVSAEFWMDLDRGYTVIALSNYEMSAMFLTMSIIKDIAQTPKTVTSVAIKK